MGTVKVLKQLSDRDSEYFGREKKLKIRKIGRNMRMLEERKRRDKYIYREKERRERDGEKIRESEKR